MLSFIVGYHHLELSLFYLAIGVERWNLNIPSLECINRCICFPVHHLQFGGISREDDLCKVVQT